MRRINVANETERVLDLIGLTAIADADVSTIPTGTRASSSSGGR